MSFRRALVVVALVATTILGFNCIKGTSEVARPPVFTLRMGEAVAPESCGDAARVCVQGHLPCWTDCWHTMAPGDGWELPLGTPLTGWTSEDSYQADAETDMERSAIPACDDKYHEACVENGSHIRVDCDSEKVLCDDEGA